MSPKTDAGTLFSLSLHGYYRPGTRHDSQTATTTERFVRDFLSALTHPCRCLRAALIALSLLTLAACSGGGSGDTDNTPGVPVNSPPTANAGADQTVAELAVVQLNGSGTDANTGDVLSFAWLQTGGTTVTISNAAAAQASFTAPDVAAGSPETLTFELRVSDGTASATDSVAITVEEPGATVTVSGTVSYEFVPPNPNCNGLNFGATMDRPVRSATVQLIKASDDTIIDSTVSSDLGDYSFSGVEKNTIVRVRARAELKRQGTPGWDVEVRNNVDTKPNPPPLASRPIYVIEGSNFDTGTSSVTRNLTAETGWVGSSYANPRAAAPFAILDAIYSGMRFVLAADPGAVFAPLDAFWSVNNTLTSPSDIDAGELQSSFYRGDIDSLFLLGDANDDTEEFDDHVIVHEWGHYFEDNFSRSDSVGGSHSLGQRIDARLAFGEGWATALASMALDDPVYCDTGTPGSSAGFGINTENDGFGTQGWFNEISITTLLYDLWDTDTDGVDTGSIGFGPIYDTMIGPQANSEAFTTIFSFAAELRSSLAPADQAFLDAQLDREDIDFIGLDIWGTDETNDIGGSPDVLPIYTDITADGSVTNLCTNSQFDTRVDSSGNRVRDGNKLTEYRLLRVSVPATDAYAVSITATTALPPDDPLDERDQSDPDMFIYRNGQLVAFGNSGVANTETFTTQSLQGPDTYVADLQDWRFADFETPAAYPDRMCFDVSFSPTP